MLMVRVEAGNSGAFFDNVFLKFLCKGYRVKLPEFELHVVITP